MNRRSFISLALAPLAAAVGAPEARLIYKQQWLREEEWDYDRHTLCVKMKACIWVYPRECEKHARWYGFQYELTRELLVDFPTIKAQMDLQLARVVRAFERDLLLGQPFDWHGRLKRRVW